MTDRDLVFKKLAAIETHVRELRTLARLDLLRNVLVHGYDSLNLGIVEEVVRNRLDDLLAFASAVRTRS